MPATDAYYRDDIGNISTSALRILDEAVELEIRPRFPLFGGWKTHYLIGYNVPSYEYLFNKGDDYVLNMRLVDHIFDDMLVSYITIIQKMLGGGIAQRLVLQKNIQKMEASTTFRPLSKMSNMTGEIEKWMTQADW